MTVDPSNTFVDTAALIEATREANAQVLAALGSLDTSVPTCPGWAMGDLVRHLGTVHRWATAAMTAAAPTPFDVVQPPAADIANTDLAGWFTDGAAAVVTTMDALSPGAPTWHPFPAAQTTDFWPRRMAHETQMHAIDAAVALGRTPTVAAAIAADGIDEYLDVILTRLLNSGRATAPSGSLHLHCTDTAGEWLLTPGPDGVDLVREHAKGDAAIRGTARDLWLTMWGRHAVAGEVDIVGDRAVADAWTAIGGN